MPDLDPNLEKDEADQDVDVDTDVVMQSYPSPTDNGQENGPFYHDNARHEQQQQAELDQQHADHIQEQLDEPPTPRQHMRSTLTSAEELQLAAQLSQGIAHGLPLMDPSDDPNLQHVMDQHGLEQHEQQHEGSLQHHDDHSNHVHDQLLSDGLNQPPDGLPDSNDQMHEQMHEQLHEQIQDQDPSLSHGQPDQQLHQHQHDQLHQGQAQQPSQHQYLTGSHQQPHLQPAAPMDHLGQHFQLSDNTPPRKRSKVSRACDECRRKKVKCDAPSETGEEPCSNCRRSNMRCLFSRIPQKRGPSKGYIKELADRIHHIEGKLASEGNTESLSELLAGSRRDSHEIFQLGQPDASNRKRPYSSLSGDFGTPSGSRHQTFGSESRPIPSYQTPSDRYKAPYSANGLAPTPSGAKSDSETPSRQAPTMDGTPIDFDQNDQTREVDETAFAAYLTVVHPVFPVLASNKTRLDGQLAQCSPSLREAFVEAFHSTVRSFPSFGGTSGNDLASAFRLIAEWETDMSPRSPVANLLHLQTLILLAISADNYGPASLKGEYGGAAKSNILGRAVGLAYTMRLHLSQVEADMEGEPDLDSDHNIGIRSWWTLVMLDRWNAISTASPLFIPNNSVVILPALRSLLGESVYHLTRLSNILGHFSPAALLPPKAMVHDVGTVPILNSFFSLSLELFREVLPTHITPSSHPILHFVYWHCRLLAYLFDTKASFSDVMWPCKETVGLLVANSQLITPLNHHFLCLTTATLLELSKSGTYREDSLAYLRELMESHVSPSHWEVIARDRIAEQIRPSTAQASMEATASQNLQHLAELATATEQETTNRLDNVGEPGPTIPGDSLDKSGVDFQALTQAGYLHSIIETRPRTSR